jgi:DNA polymerase-1
VLVQLKEDCDLPVALDDFKLTAIPPEPLGRVPGRARVQPACSSGWAKGAVARSARFSLIRRSRSMPVLWSFQAGAARRWPNCRQSTDRFMPACRRGALAGWIARAFRGAAGGLRYRNQRARCDARRSCRGQPGAGPNQACYIPLGHGGTDMFAEKPQQVRQGRALALLKPLLESDAVLKVGQNIKYDLNVLARHGITVSPIDDTMVMSFCLDAGRSIDGMGGGHGMDELAMRHLGHTTSPSKMSAAAARRRSRLPKCR